MGRDRKAGEVIAVLPVKWKEILTGVCEIHCCCPWRAPKAPPSLHRAEHFSSSWAMERFLKGCVSPEVSEEMSSPLCSSATSPWQHLAFCSQLRNLLAPVVFSLNLELELTDRHNFLCMTLCCLPDVLLHVDIHRSEGNIAPIKSSVGRHLVQSTAPSRATFHAGWGCSGPCAAKISKDEDPTVSLGNASVLHQRQVEEPCKEPLLKKVKNFCFFVKNPCAWSEFAWL